MARLSDWVARARWTAYEAKFILAGLDPELTMHDGMWAPAWLPGGLRAAWLQRNGTEDRFSISMEISDEIGTTAEFCDGDPRSPRQWLERALAAHYAPPWLELIDTNAPPFDRLADQKGCQVEPLSSLEQSPKPSVQSLGGLAKAKGDEPINKAKQILLSEWDQRNRDPIFDTPAFRREMKERLVSRMRLCTDRSVDTWVRQLVAEKAGGSTPSWAQDSRGQKPPVP